MTGDEENPDEVDTDEIEEVEVKEHLAWDNLYSSHACKCQIGMDHRA